MRVRPVLYLLLAVGSVCLLAAILFPVFAKARIGGPRKSCLGNIHALSQAMLMYDNENISLPAANAWMDRLAPLVHSEATFHCPEVFRENRFTYGYAMQTRLGDRNVYELSTPGKEPMVFDSFPIGRNAHTKNPIIPGFSRHGGQNIGYADGHAKYLKSR